MNFLSYKSRSSQLNGLIFDLLIDQKTIPELIGCASSGIPYFLVQSDLPGVNDEPTLKPDCRRIVAVCSCGEFGCGGISARVFKTENSVVFSDFVSDNGPIMNKQFEFTRANYDKVLRVISDDASRYLSMTKSANSRNFEQPD